MHRIYTYHYVKRIKLYAKENRKAMNEAERLVRHCILKQNKTGKKRVKQKIIDRYILDFYCASCKLCIEIDWSSHDLKNSSDTKRDQYLQKQYGIETVRFSDQQVFRNLQGVFDAIIAKCK